MSVLSLVVVVIFSFRQLAIFVAGVTV